MSKIVILSAQLGAPQVIDDLLGRLITVNPALADWVRQFDSKPLILECVNNALSALGNEAGITLSTDVADYYGNQHASVNGQQLIGSLKTSGLPNGLGIMVNGQGTISFAADDYKSGWKAEINRLRNKFQDAFLAEVTNSILQIIGYNTSVNVVNTGGETLYAIEGVKE